MMLRNREEARSDDIEAGAAVEVGDQRDRPEKPFSSRDFQGEPYLNVRVEISRHDILIGEGEGVDPASGGSPCRGIDSVARADVASKTVVEQCDRLARRRYSHRNVAIWNRAVDVQRRKRDGFPDIAVDDRSGRLRSGKERRIAACQSA